MRFRPACSRSRKKRAAALCPLCFHPKLPAKLAFAPYPLGFKFGYCILENKQSESTDHPIEVPLSSRGIQPFFSTKGSAASHGRIHPIFYKGTIAPVAWWTQQQEIECSADVIATPAEATDLRCRLQSKPAEDAVWNVSGCQLPSSYMAECASCFVSVLGYFEPPVMIIKRDLISAKPKQPHESEMSTSTWRALSLLFPFDSARSLTLRSVSWKVCFSALKT